MPAPGSLPLSLVEQVLEVGDVVAQGLPANFSQAIERLRLARDKAFFDGDIRAVFELAQMDAGIAVGGLGGVADCRKVGDRRTGEKGDDRQSHPAVQNFVDRAVVEIGHATGRARRRSSRIRPGPASNRSISAAESNITSGRWGNA